MEVKSFRAKTLRDALRQVQRELGSDAAVLQTREVWDGWLRGLIGHRRVEVFASAGMSDASSSSSCAASVASSTNAAPAESADAHGVDLTRTTIDRADIIPFPQAENLHHRVCELRESRPSGFDSSPAQFQLFTQLLEADWSEQQARALVAKAGQSTSQDANIGELEAAAYQSICEIVRVQGPIRVVPGQRTVVALVGPTGVGKTTTIAKLAANFRLRQKNRVALVTVDTYRIAAVEQLRTYAEIIDLPMHVVSSPDEMRVAIDDLADFDLVLLDTAGRSPHDEIRIQELNEILAAAQADEVHLVLSATCGSRALRRTAAKFATVGVTSLLLTKLDECSGLGDVMPLLEECHLPVSYVTNGQNVPDDIQDARVADLPQVMMGFSAAA